MRHATPRARAKGVEGAKIECYNKQMRSLALLTAALVVVIAAAACPKNAGKKPVTTCTTQGGAVLQVGDQGPEGDGCNTCACNPDFTLTCTQFDCTVGEGEGSSAGEGEGVGGEGE